MRNNGCKKTQILNMFTSFTNDFVLWFAGFTNAFGLWFASETLDFSLRLIVAVLTITVLLITSTVSQANIIGAWLFDEGSGNVLKDASGKGHDGVITGGKWIEGKLGKALSCFFDSRLSKKQKDWNLMLILFWRLKTPKVFSTYRKNSPS